MSATTGSDLDLGPFALGTFEFGSTIESNTAFSLLDEFASLGGRFIDTAASYGTTDDGAAHAEQLIGRWLTATRADIRVGSKGGLDPALPSVGRLDRRELLTSLDRSRERLNLERLDFY